MYCKFTKNWLIGKEKSEFMLNFRLKRKKVIKKV